MLCVCVAGLMRETGRGEGKRHLQNDPAWLEQPPPDPGRAKPLTDPALPGKQGAAVGEPRRNHAWLNSSELFYGIVIRALNTSMAEVPLLCSVLLVSFPSPRAIALLSLSSE